MARKRIHEEKSSWKRGKEKEILKREERRRKKKQRRKEENKKQKEKRVRKADREYLEKEVYTKLSKGIQRLGLSFYIRAEAERIYQIVGNNHKIGSVKITEHLDQP